MHELQWFLDRVGSYILRGTTEVFINDEETAKKLHATQSEEYKFSEKIRVHRKPPDDCPACEA
jgi:hypothetical protein